MRDESEWGNSIEGAVQRYWAAFRKWRGIEDPGDMTVEELITELNDLQRFRGRVAFMAEDLLEDVVHDRRTVAPANDITQTA